MITISKVLLIILSFLLLSCGTIGSRRNIIPVDSSPRGASVYADDNEPLGTTPFFLIKEKKLNQEFKFVLGNKTETVDSHCSINWSEAFIPDLLPAAFFPIGTAISGAFLITDWMTGQIYRCSNPLICKFSTSTSPVTYLQKKQRRIILLPPSFDDYLEAKKVASQVFSSQHIDGKVIPWGEAEEVLSFFGLESSHLDNIDNIPNEHWREVALRLEASHLFYFRREGERFHPILRDMISGEEELFPILAYKEKRSFRSYFSSAFSLFPNAATASFMNSLSANSLDSADDHQVKKHPSSVPAFMSLWGLESISNPRILSPWDFEFHLSPFISFPAFRYQTADEWVNGQRYSIGPEGAVSFHTPFGALRVALGLAASYASYEDSQGHTDHFYAGLSPIISLAYYAFITERFYFKISSINYYFREREYNGQLSGATLTLFTFGYYLPHFKWKMQKLLVR